MPARRIASVCSVVDCDRPHSCRTFCKMHYSRWRATGDPLSVKKPHRVAVVDGRKTCAACGEWKPLDRFPPQPKAAHGRGSHCYDCRAVPKALARYGITRQQYDDLVRQHDGRCAICDRKVGVRALCVDHDHATGAVRGLLCSACNSALGLFRDDPNVLRAAAGYVESHTR